MEPKHALHSGYFHPVLRQWQSANVDVKPENLMLPIFILDEPNSITEIQSMPGVKRYGMNKLKGFIDPLIAKGLKSVLLFGVSNKLIKDENASSADCPNNPIIQAVPLLRKLYPHLIIACDVCICPYSSHGHCGILNSNGTIQNEKSIQRISEIAVAYAKAGAHIVAPSDMMDGRIKAIKLGLASAGLSNQVAVLSYAVKFASGFYGPFRDAAGSSPKFGDRQCYQLPSGSTGLAARAAARDVDEGADMLMLTWANVERPTCCEHADESRPGTFRWRGPIGQSHDSAAAAACPPAHLPGSTSGVLYSRAAPIFQYQFSIRERHSYTAAHGTRNLSPRAALSTRLSSTSIDRTRKGRKYTSEN
ncbi:unnamed protein product [Trichogramma brassicae]|uniref:porphobilinogen synthase n=1 Tax=Trichogramma brassicae TaxID=86971 RepID=A0A6H5IHA8_9HYME|nr:unnamed protein product [Trichogramma brassicae]